MSYRAFTSIALFSSLLAAAACSAGENGSPNDTPDGGGDLSPDDDNGLAPDDDDGPDGRPDDPRTGLPVREKVCDDQGNCTCLRLALLGTLDSSAAKSDTQPFIDWLNGNSDGTATLTRVDVKPTLTAEYLAQYDILLIANINTWTFSQEEKDAVAVWVREGGGGIVNITGFNSTGSEPANTSQLISFAGVSYFSPDGSAPGTVANPNQGGAATPVYYQGGSTNLKQCLGWPSAYEAKDTTAVPFIQQTGALEKLTANVNYVGAFHGWAVQGPEGSTVVANDPLSGKPIALAHEVDGAGRIFAFGDEWVIFANQWRPTGLPDNQQRDSGNQCYDASLGEPPFHSTASLYQTKQFWYNAINWVAPPNECNFVVDDPEVIIVR